jgi:hypothetical protein
MCRPITPCGMSHSATDIALAMVASIVGTSLGPAITVAGESESVAAKGKAGGGKPPKPYPPRRVLERS